MLKSATSTSCEPALPIKCSFQGARVGSPDGPGFSYHQTEVPFHFPFGRGRPDIAVPVDIAHLHVSGEGTGMYVEFLQVDNDTRRVPRCGWWSWLPGRRAGHRRHIPDRLAMRFPRPRESMMTFTHLGFKERTGLDDRNEEQDRRNGEHGSPKQKIQADDRPLHGKHLLSSVRSKACGGDTLLCHCHERKSRVKTNEFPLDDPKLFPILPPD